MSAEIPTLEPALIDFQQALRLLGISRNTLYRLLRRRKIPGAMKLGGTWRLNHQILLDFIACKSLGTSSKKR